MPVIATATPEDPCAAPAQPAPALPEAAELPEVCPKCARSVLEVCSKCPRGGRRGGRRGRRLARHARAAGGHEAWPPVPVPGQTSTLSLLPHLPLPLTGRGNSREEVPGSGDQVAGEEVRRSQVQVTWWQVTR